MSPEKIVVIVVLVSLMLQTGLQFDRANLMTALKDWSLLSRAFLANFILIPIFGVIIVRLFHLSDDIATGVLLMAIAPGVPFAVRSAGRKSGGSLSFALCLAFFMPAISIITVPITAALVFPAGSQVHITFTSLIVNLLFFQLVPLLIGLAISDRAPALAAKLDKPLLVVFAVALLILIVFIFPAIIKSFASVYGSYGLISALILVLLSIVTGYLLGGPDPAYRHTLSIATALRNIGLAALVANADFAGTLVGAAVMTYFFIQFILAAIAGKVFGGKTKAPKAPTPVAGAAS